MNKRMKKISAYILTGMIILESVFIHVQTDIYSVENGLAKQKEAIEWLVSNQNDDGSWGDETKLKDTSQVLKYAENDWFTETVMGAAVEWINSQKASNYDEIYRINSKNKLQQSIDIEEVVRLQNMDGGWSMSESYQSDVFDTLLALEACLNADEIQEMAIKKGVTYILLNQMESGAL